MIYTGPQPLVKNVPRILETLVDSLRHTLGFPTPVLLQALAQPLRTALPIRQPLPPAVITYPALSSARMPCSITLIGASLLRGAVGRNFSSASKPAVAEPHQSLGELTVQSETSVSPEPKTSRPKRVLIADSAWHYSLYKVEEQYFFMLLYGRVAQNILYVPLTAEETALALSGEAALDTLAKHIERHISVYKPRHISPL